MFTEITTIELWHGTDAGDEEIFATVNGRGLIKCSDEDTGMDAGEHIDVLRRGLEELFSDLYQERFDVRFPELGE